MATEEYTAEYTDEPGEEATSSEIDPSSLVEEPGKTTPQEEEEEEVKKEEPAKETSNKEEEEEILDGETFIEQQAREQGWVPFEEWKGDPKEWRPADVFLERGEYFRTMKSQKDQIQNLQKQVQEMADMQTKIRQDERQKTIDDLKSQKKEAMRDQDFETAEDLDEKIESEREKARQEENNRNSSDNNVEANAEQEVIDDWMSKNPWYQNDPEKQEFADNIGMGYKSRNPNATAQEVLNFVDKQMEKFYSPSNNDEEDDSPSSSKKSSSPVAQSNTTTTPKNSKRGKKKGYNDLNDTQKQIAQKFVDSGAFNNVDEYIAELEKIGDL